MDWKSVQASGVCCFLPLYRLMFHTWSVLLSSCIYQHSHPCQMNAYLPFVCCTIFMFFSFVFSCKLALFHDQPSCKLAPFTQSITALSKHQEPFHQGIPSPTKAWKLLIFSLSGFSWIWDALMDVSIGQQRISLLQDQEPSLLDDNQVKV